MGATTIWERWDSLLPDGTVNPGEMTSFNHYALGAVADWLHRVVGGLAPAAPRAIAGWLAAAAGRRPDLGPRPASTPYGLAECPGHWRTGRSPLKSWFHPTQPPKSSYPAATDRRLRLDRERTAVQPIPVSARSMTAMQWTELTSDAFPAAVAQCGGVCLVPLSVVERHGHHLPLGTDMYIGRELCRRAACAETGAGFPDNISTQIPEARHVPVRSVSRRSDPAVLLNNLCREIARNGLKKSPGQRPRRQPEPAAVFQRTATVRAA